MTRRADILRRIVICVAVIGLFYMIRFYHSRYGEWADLRESLAGSQTGTLQVAVVWPRDRHRASSLIRGAILAAEEINRTGGIRLAAPDRTEYASRLELRFFDESSPRAGVNIARDIATDADIKAVVGHDTSSAVKASLIYNLSGTLFISPMNIDPALTMHGFHNVFSIAPDGAHIAQAMVDSVQHLTAKKQIRLAVLSPAGLEDALHEELADRLDHHAHHVIEAYGNQVDFRVVFSQSYQPGQSDYDELIDPLVPEMHRFNSVLIMDDQADGVRLRNQLEQRFAVAGAAENSKRIFDLRNSGTVPVLVTYSDLSQDELDGLVDNAARLVLREFRQKVAVLATRDDQGNIIGSNLWSYVDETRDHPVNGLELAVYQTFAPENDVLSHVPITAKLLQRDVEFVFLAGTAPTAHGLIRHMREGGMNKPIICVPGLEPRILRPLVERETQEFILNLLKDDESLSANEIVDRLEQDTNLLQTQNRSLADTRQLIEWYLAKVRLDHWLAEDPHMEVNDLLGRLHQRFPHVNISESAVRGYVADYHGGTYVAAAFNPWSSSRQIQDFERDYQRRWQSGPADSLAAAGYQSIRMLADAFHRAGSASPRNAAAAMLMYVGEGGIFGTNWFSPGGDMLGMEIVMKRLAPDGSIMVFEVGESSDNESTRQLPVDPWGE